MRAAVYHVLSIQFATISAGIASCDRSASRAKSSRFGSLTCGTGRKIGATVAAPHGPCRRDEQARFRPPIDEPQPEPGLADRDVNVIRAFPGRGLLVWGARTLSDDPARKYVPVRRLFLFLEHSISEGLHWTVFEPNDDRLWVRITNGIQDFLQSLWRHGGLQGQTSDEAFFVACGRTTMTEADIRDGRLICNIGIAPVRPAEFVILRINQRAVATPP